MRRVFLVVLAGVLLGLPTTSRAVEAQKDRGLFITPVRQYVTNNPGQIQTGTLTVANITDKTAVVTLSVEQFRVEDYTYNHRFETLREKWVTLSTDSFTLLPGKSQTVTYSVAPPANATPGGHYFTIFASSVLHTGNVASTVQAATTMYVTVNGDLKRTAVITKETIPFISFGGDISFKLDVKGTGNAHFFTYSSGQLFGLSARGRGSESTHLLIPGASRVLGSTIPAPILPGVYKAVYGYRTDTGQSVQHERYIVYLPLWSLLIPIGIVWLVILIRKKRRGY